MGNFSGRECTNLQTSAYKANTIPIKLPCPFKLNLIDCKGVGYLNVFRSPEPKALQVNL